MQPTLKPTQLEKMAQHIAKEFFKRHRCDPLVIQELAKYLSEISDSGQLSRLEAEIHSRNVRIEQLKKQIKSLQNQLYRIRSAALT